MGLLGPNGAGKSTIMRMIAGAQVPCAGQIIIDGHDMADDPRAARARVGWLPEGAPAPAELPVQEFLLSMGRVHGLAAATARVAVEKWIGRCELESVRRRPIGHLSRGFRQRVGLAAALLHAPALVVLDEPATGLDPSQVASFRSLAKEIADDAAVLYSSHHLAEVEATCDGVAVMCDGRVVLSGNFEDLRGDAEMTLAEVAPHQCARALSSAKCAEIDEQWMRCTIAATAEEVFAEVAASGGRLRVLRGGSETLEEAYLRLIDRTERDA